MKVPACICVGRKGESHASKCIDLCNRDEAHDIMTSFGLTDEEKMDYDVVKTKFDGHFVVRRNAIFERAKFNRRSQEECESVDSFITSQYCLAEHCEYGVLKEEMIRDRIVVRIIAIIEVANGWCLNSKKLSTWLDKTRPLKRNKPF